ncbi:MAG: hypothetical protein DI586_01755 [Micavibrio aeruginosavorus]|uniref:DUF2066 domain-containing protein n=1 Tax=Micavibrio aeruginosavorus TaxID=349221 RepID=A0A2W5HN09_9BACT|nr:MAG: hypothetical protein DI586_01755 [Micavibrio aeruginosavorus]
MFRTAPILLFMLIWMPVLAIAQTNPAYVVHDVKVDIVAESSVKARNQAFSAAQEKAFKMLSERFLAPEQMTGFTAPEAAVIAGMVSDFEITSEQLSKRRYLGTYIFRFKPASVNRFFGHGPTGDFQSDSSGAQKLLLIPAFSQNGALALWDLKKNPWLQAWQKQSEGDNSNLIIPAGNVSDTMDMREANPEKFSQSSIKRMKSRYGVYDLAIVSAVFDQSAANILKVNIYRTDRGRIELAQSFPVPTGSAKRLGELLNNAVPQIKTIMTGNWKNQEFYVDPALAAEMATEATAAPQSQASPYAPQAGHIKATARFNTMGDWLSMRRSLNGIPPLKSIRIISLTTNQASMEFTYSDWMALTSALSARGLSLQSIGPGEYNINKINPAGYSR